MSDPSSPSGRIRRRLIYHGRVQGVGFRYTTNAIARRLPVVGYVRNLPDGTVELVVDGEPQVVDRFLDEIAQSFPGQIDSVNNTQWSSDEAFDRFEIRR